MGLIGVATGQKQWENRASRGATVLSSSKAGVSIRGNCSVVATKGGLEGNMIGEIAKYGSTTFMKVKEFNGPNKIMIVTNQPTGTATRRSVQERKPIHPPRTAQ